MKIKTPKIITLILSLFLLFTGFTPLGIPSTYADAVDICHQNNVSSEVRRANGCYGDATNNLASVITSIINAVIGVIGIVAVIFIIVGGVNYMTSAGDAAKIEKAKKTILWAVVGLVIAALAFAIVNFVITGILKQ